MIDRRMNNRITPLNDIPGRDGKCIVYWMQSSLRLSDNPALALAIGEANARRLPLLVFFSIDPSIPMANERNFTFALESLAEVVRGLPGVNASLCLRIGRATDNAVAVCREADAALLITDESHLQEGARRRGSVAGRVNVPALQVDANVVVPVRLIPQEQYAAYAIRPKLLRLLGNYLQPFDRSKVNAGQPVDIRSDLDAIDIRKVLPDLELPRVKPSQLYRGGEHRAQSALREFVDRKLDGFAENRNRPDRHGTSDMSPYLRFGCISPVSMLKQVIDSCGPKGDISAFVEEAFVRRELAENFTFYNPGYRSLACLPEWARRTLSEHRADRREVLFSLEELEAGVTGEALWDASQREMLETGKMAGYMRMYWGKRVLAWTRTPDEALRTLLYLNDKYEIDGRSPNSYAGVLWCFGKHDRAFAERPVYGKVRYMAPSAQRKKFNVEAYIKTYVKKQMATH